MISYVTLGSYADESPYRKMQQGTVVDEVRHHATHHQEELEEADQEAADSPGGVLRYVGRSKHRPRPEAETFDKSKVEVSHFAGNHQLARLISGLTFRYKTQAGGHTKRLA